MSQMKIYPATWGCVVKSRLPNLTLLLLLLLLLFLLLLLLLLLLLWYILRGLSSSKGLIGGLSSIVQEGKNNRKERKTKRKKKIKKKKNSSEDRRRKKSKQTRRKEERCTSSGLKVKDLEPEKTYLLYFLFCRKSEEKIWRKKHCDSGIWQWPLWTSVGGFQGWPECGWLHTYCTLFTDAASHVVDGGRVMWRGW